MNQTLLKQCVAEFIGTFALIGVGVGAMLSQSQAHLDWLGVALAQGLTMAVMVTATGAISGGHLNPAITFGVLVGGHISVKRAIAYWLAQLAGAVAAAYLIIAIASGNGVQIVAAGTPDLADYISQGQGMAIEAALTFFLVFVFYGSAVDPRAPKIGGLAIGLTIVLGLLVGGPLTGGAMNPARTFGPALASGHWNNNLVYWIGPMLGGALAGLIYGRFLIKPAR
jgi:MIP family channel proteins